MTGSETGTAVLLVLFISRQRKSIANLLVEKKLNFLEKDMTI